MENVRLDQRPQQQFVLLSVSYMCRAKMRTFNINSSRLYVPPLSGNLFFLFI